MKENKNIIYAVIIAVAIIGAAAVLGSAYKNRNSNGTINVTGLGEASFVSDLIVWEGSFSAISLEKSKKITSDYLTSKGVNKNDIVFSAVETTNETKTEYSPNGKYIGNTFVGYRLSQQVKVESQEVEKIETIAREITELLNKGVKFYSQSPRYYYTKLADTKLDLISRATEDAHSRATQIASKSGAKLGTVLKANMGVFQITGQNSNENYSWGGTLNTKDKKKTASITMKLIYRVD